jgi:hypothetical protein
MKNFHTVGGGCGVDIHAHMVPENFLQFLRSSAGRHAT